MRYWLAALAYALLIPSVFLGTLLAYGLIKNIGRQPCGYLVEQQLGGEVEVHFINACEMSIVTNYQPRNVRYVSFLNDGQETQAFRLDTVNRVTPSYRCKDFK